MFGARSFALVGCLLVTTVAVCATLKSVLSFDLPGPSGKRFDYLTIDYDDHYLLSAHLAAGLIYVIDLRTNRVVKAIPDVPGAEGVEFVPELKKVYTSNSGDNTIGVIDLKRMKVIKKLPTEAKPDGSAYAAPYHKLYVSDERGKAEAIVDVQQDKIIKTLHFDSETGMPQYDSVARKIYVNLQDQNVFAVIDPATDEVVGRYSVGKCEGNHGMALDPEHRRAFLACYSGAISVFQEDDADHFRKLEDFPVQKKVHSLAVDKDMHRVYVPEQEVDGRPAARMTVYEAVTGQSATLR